MTPPTPPKPAGDVAHVHAQKYINLGFGDVLQCGDQSSLPYREEWTDIPKARIGQTLTKGLHGCHYRRPVKDGALVPVEEKEIQSNPQPRKEGDETCIANAECSGAFVQPTKTSLTQAIQRSAADESPIPSSGGTTPRATATPLSDKQWTTPFTLNDDILRRWYDFARALETQLAETRAERDQINQRIAGFAQNTNTNECQTK